MGCFSGLDVLCTLRMGLWFGVLGRHDTTTGGGGGGCSKLVLDGCEAGMQVEELACWFSAAGLFSLAGLLLLTSSAKLMALTFEGVTGG